MLQTVVTPLASAVRQAITLRDYQSGLVESVNSAWSAGAVNVLAVLPTGGGKTVIFSHIIAAEQGASCAIAHRQELVGQIAVALARNGVRHRIIAPAKTIKQIVALEMQEVGVSYYDPNAPCAIAGVDTLVRRADQLNAWLPKVRLWVMDEAHHVLVKNKWGKATEMFPNARGLGVTATPERADGCGLGREADGVFDDMVVGPTMRELIDRGFLTDYRVVCPQTDIDLDSVAISQATGDYNPQQLKKAVRKSRIIGDVVAIYKRWADGLRSIVFSTDVETATDISKRFNELNVPAEVVSAKTPDLERAAIMRRFREGILKVLVNVDLFGEGFDLPAIECVIMARPTQSYSLYAQQFGRALRIMEGKDRALIIDHVGNVVRHGLPDAARYWSLQGKEKRKRSVLDKDTIPLRTCLNDQCLQVYERALLSCPYCGHTNEPQGRSSPEQVDGDLVELDPEVLAQMRGEVARIDGPARFPANVPPKVRMSINKKHVERQDAQGRLRAVMQWWGGHRNAEGYVDREAQKRFFFRFGIDVLTAQTLSAREAAELADTITNDLIEGYKQ